METRTPRPFDARLSNKLDRLIDQLDRCATDATLRRCWLRLQKRLAECNVPAFRKAVAR